MKAKEARIRGALEAVRQALKGYALGAGYSARETTFVTCSTVEAILQSILLSYFAHSGPEVDEVFEHALRNLQDRIDIAYCIGLIDRDLAESLRQLARIRNVFAHDITVMSLTDKQVLPKLQGMGISVAANDWQRALEQFREYVEMILSRLLRLSLEVWAKDCSLKPLASAYDQDWERAMAMPLCETGVFCSKDTDTLLEFGIVKVEDILSGGNALFLELIAVDVHALTEGIAVWIASELGRQVE